MLDSIDVTENHLSPFVGKYIYDGTVLGCCSGSGAFVRYAVDKGVSAKFLAADYSIEMTKPQDSKALYEEPILIGPIQEVLMQASVHDHVVRFGSFHLFKAFDFVSALRQSFLRTRKSVTFDVGDLSQLTFRDQRQQLDRNPERNSTTTTIMLLLLFALALHLFGGRRSTMRGGLRITRL
ncbi:hypothetical protein F5B21DRAFT_505809 [Xylaria acuta]|nr:hypothetical protein F5B21DRAFT_505809 [Xylaria acuta]